MEGERIQNVELGIRKPGFKSLLSILYFFGVDPLNSLSSTKYK